MELTFLGTSCMVPTKDRAQTAMILEHNGEYILIDSGESVQRQISIAGLKAPKIRKILLTHWHGDHVLGLPGLLQTLSASNQIAPLDIFGPPGIKEKITSMLSVFDFDNRLHINVHEIKEGVFFESEEYVLSSAEMKHRILCMAYSFELKEKRRIDLKKAEKKGLKQGPLLGKLNRGEIVEIKGKKILPKEVTYAVPGKKVSFVFDTSFTTNAVEISKNADVLVCEAVYTKELKEKAKEHKHLTSEDAAKIAKKAKAKKLVLTHLSQRYKDKTPLLKEAKKIFKNTVLAEDFMKIRI